MVRFPRWNQLKDLWRCDPARAPSKKWQLNKFWCRTFGAICSHFYQHPSKNVDGCSIAPPTSALHSQLWTWASELENYTVTQRNLAAHRQRWTTNSLILGQPSQPPPSPTYTLLSIWRGQDCATLPAALQAQLFQSKNLSTINCLRAGTRFKIALS